MQVNIMQATQIPLDLISLAAGCCYGKNDISHTRAIRCIRNGHTSVMEHAVATFKIAGISRACLAQLTRHRIASFSVKSQRYCKMEGDDWFVKPKTYTGITEADFLAAMQTSARSYKNALNASIKPEDARFLLPEATKTDLFMTINARSLQNLFKLRLAPEAQWEIRELAGTIRDELCKLDQWKELVEVLLDD